MVNYFSENQSYSSFCRYIFRKTRGKGVDEPPLDGRWPSSPVDFSPICRQHYNTRHMNIFYLDSIYKFKYLHFTTSILFIIRHFRVRYFQSLSKYTDQIFIGSKGLMTRLISNGFNEDLILMDYSMFVHTLTVHMWTWIGRKCYEYATNAWGS